MNYEMKEIKTHWIGGCFKTIPMTCGWSFYPIKYKGSPYVVDIKADVHGYEIPDEPADVKVFCSIYEYENEKKLFRKHRRKRVFKSDCSILHIDKNPDTFVTMALLPEEEFRHLLPKIMKGIFAKWEYIRQQSSEKAEKVFDEREEWDGVVEEVNDI